MPNVDPELADAATDVAWRLVAYGSYGRSRAAALRAVVRRRPQFERDACASALSLAIALVEDARAVVSSNAGLINYRGDTDLAPFRAFLQDHVQIFGRDPVDGIVGMAVFYDHLK